MTKKTKILGVLGVVGLAVGLLTYSLSPTEQPSTGIKVGARLAELHDFSGEKLKGQYYLLHFWAKWCEPCTDEIPHLVEFAKSLKLERPLYVLAVSLDPTLEEAKTILPNQGKDLPSTFLLALDSSHHVAESFGSYQYPETYLVGPEGQIIEKWIGAQKWQRPEVLEYFKSKIK